MEFIYLLQENEIGNNGFKIYFKEIEIIWSFF